MFNRFGLPGVQMFLGLQTTCATKGFSQWVNGASVSVYVGSLMSNLWCSQVLGVSGPNPSSSTNTSSYRSKPLVPTTATHGSQPLLFGSPASIAAQTPCGTREPFRVADWPPMDPEGGKHPMEDRPPQSPYRFGESMVGV